MLFFFKKIKTLLQFTFEKNNLLCKKREKITCREEKIPVPPVPPPPPHRISMVRPLLLRPLMFLTPTGAAIFSLNEQQAPVTRQIPNKDRTEPTLLNKGHRSKAKARSKERHMTYNHNTWTTEQHISGCKYYAYFIKISLTKIYQCVQLIAFLGKMRLKFRFWVCKTRSSKS